MNSWRRTILCGKSSAFLAEKCRRTHRRRNGCVASAPRPVGVAGGRIGIGCEDHLGEARRGQFQGVEPGATRAPRTIDRIQVQTGEDRQLPPSTWAALPRPSARRGVLFASSSASQDRDAVEQRLEHWMRHQVHQLEGRRMGSRTPLRSARSSRARCGQTIPHIAFRCLCSSSGKRLAGGTRMRNEHAIRSSARAAIVIRHPHHVGG